MTKRVLVASLLVAALSLIGPSAATSAAEFVGSPDNERRKVRTCGILPGDGAYSYVETWNVGCAKANKVANEVTEQFCGPAYRRCDVEVGEFVRGHEDYRNWDCAIKHGWEFHRVRCEAPHKRFVQESAA